MNTSTPSISRRILLGLCLGLFLVLFGSSCNSVAYSVKVPALDPVPDASSGNALVIFLRPSGYAASFPSTIYDVTGEIKVLGVPYGHMKMSFVVPAGKRRFMTDAENIDFIDAELLAGKTYYVLISPRLGIMRAQLRLIAFKRKPAEPDFKLGGEQLKKWLADCAPAGNTPVYNSFMTPKVIEKLNKRKDESIINWAKFDRTVKNQHLLAPEDGE